MNYRKRCWAAFKHAFSLKGPYSYTFIHGSVSRILLSSPYCLHYWNNSCTFVKHTKF